jgi:hypothetical protein
LNYLRGDPSGSDTTVDGGLDVVMLRQNVLKASTPTMDDFEVAAQE